MNLAVNARDAMPQGGKLTIETANAVLDAAQVDTHQPVAPALYVMLAVSDTGVGMDPETRSHVFEPFFTTKEYGKGTGPGLSTVYGMVEERGGHIRVHSEPGRGTTFKIYLPRVEDAVEPAGPSARPGELLGGAETVLLVEDHAAVRDVARGVLLENGYAVLEARHAGGAVEVCELHEGPIDLLLTDVVMPQMSGRELAERLTLLRPGVKVLYMSGYTDDAVVRRGGLDPGTAFLERPFAPDTLARKVREVLDTPQLPRSSAGQAEDEPGIRVAGKRRETRRP